MIDGCVIEVTLN